jgi:hypothetical protein
LAKSVTSRLRFILAARRGAADNQRQSQGRRAAHDIGVERLKPRPQSTPAAILSASAPITMLAPAASISSLTATSRETMQGSPAARVSTTAMPKTLGKRRQHQ